MSSTQLTNRQLAEEQQRKQLEQFYNVDQVAAEELTKALADKTPEKVQKRSGWVRSSWGKL